MKFPIRKHLQPVAVARLLPFSAFALLACLAIGSTAQAESNLNIALLHAHTPEELAGILDQAEAWSNTRSGYPEHAIAIVLHGQEANVFVKQNYQMYRQLVDKAARLDAFNVVDIKICETWMGMNQIDRDQLPAFVDTVPFGPAEQQRFLKAGYQKF